MQFYVLGRGTGVTSDDPDYTAVKDLPTGRALPILLFSQLNYEYHFEVLCGITRMVTAKNTMKFQL